MKYNNLDAKLKSALPLPVLLFVACSAGLGNAANASSTEEANRQEEVLVTARKRAESPLRVPIALSVFDETTINSPLIDDISTLGSLTPNVEFSTTSPLAGSTNAATVFIRGVGQNDFLLTTDPGVGIYLDGVYIARSIGGVLQLADIERVEILRGPQGTLFGKNTIGGAIQVVSRKPSTETEGTISATFGEFNRADLKASIEGSLSENLQARFSVQSERRDGYADRILDGGKLGDIDRQSLRAKFTWQSSDVTQWDLSLDHTHQRQEAIPQTLLEVTPTALSATYNLLVGAPQGTAWDDRWITNDPYKTFQTGPSQDDADISGVSISVNHQWSATELTAITGYRRLTADYARDPDNSPLQYGHGLNHDDHKQFSQEFRLNGTAMEQRLDWLAGIYYFREHGKNLTEGFLFSGLLQATGNPALDFDFNVNNDITTESSALFTQFTGHLTDRLNLTAGLRYTYENKEFSVNNFTLNTGFQFVGPETVDDSWNNASPMLSLDYQLNDNTMTYFSASRSFKSGGFNGRQIFTGPVNRYDPEFANSYELGIKTRFTELATTLEAAVFSVDYKDMQFTTLVNAVTPLIDNAAKAEIDGIEVSLIRQVAAGFSFNTGVGYLNARYTDIDNSIIITGNEDLVRTPEWSAHLQLGYTWQLNNIGAIELTGFADYKSKVYHDSINTPKLAEGDLTIVNASLGWTSKQADWQIEAFVTNLTDETYLLSGSSDTNVFGGTEGYFASPKEWGLRASFNY